MAFPFSIRLFLWSLVVLLLGYLFLGRGFAHVGIGPLYVGEAVLFLGILILVFWNLWTAPIQSSISWLLALFVCWGAIRTIPYIPIHGMDALRDAAVWGYGLFALVTAAVVYRLGLMRRLLSAYSSLAPILICAVPLLFLVSWTVGGVLPSPPGSELPILYLKAGDTAVHLGIVMAFLLLGLHQWNRPPQEVSFNSRLLILLPVWILGFALVGIINRGGFLAVAGALAITAALTPFKKEIFRLGLVFAFIFTTALVLDVEIETERRTLSARQIVVNFQAAFAKGGEEEHQQANYGTVSWRLQWWQEVIDDTIHGPRFWTGRGFGENLNDGTYGPLRIRSPHNSHLTILARMGVPGLALWLIMQGLVAWKLLFGYIVAARLGKHLWMRVNTWLLASLAAFNVNTFFDVYLEGPQGGIWFWCTFGLAIAALQQQWDEYRMEVAPLPLNSEAQEPLRLAKVA